MITLILLVGYLIAGLGLIGCVVFWTQAPIQTKAKGRIKRFPGRKVVGGNERLRYL